MSASKVDCSGPRFIDVLLRENPELVTVDGRPAATPSTAKVNVLADLDELIESAEAEQDYCSERGPNEAMRRAVELQAIRDVVAELIEAAQCARSFIAVVRDGAGLASGETLAALNAALARIGGGAA